MAFVSNNNAYDISLFDESNAAVQSPARKRPERRPQRRRQNQNRNKVVRIPRKKIEQNRRRKHNKLKLAFGFTISAIIVFVTGIIIYGNVQMTELNQQIADAEETLKNTQSEYTQMQMNVDAKYTTSIIEEYAKNELGMTKATNAQKEFVDLSDGDKAEITVKSEESIFDKIADAISSLWS
ncbi:MAG: septum formation initiator family protein [Ruminococcus sp.]|nr:septum formation initiator family protein [Ruminococcus sp.]